MIGYLFLFIALICGVVKGYCGKMSGGAVTRPADAMLVNTARMIFCIIIGVVAIPARMIFYGDGSIQISFALIITSAVAGIGTAAFTVSWLLSVKRGAYMLVDVFLLIGVIFPILLCRVFFNEQIRPLQWIGFFLLVIAAYVMCSYNKSLNGKTSLGTILLLLLCALSNGAIGFAQKVFVKSVDSSDIALFNIFTYIFAAIVLAICTVAFKRGEERTVEAPRGINILKSVIGYIIVMAVCLFLDSYFNTLAASHLDAAQLFPLQKGGALILSVLMSSLIFKEKINFKCIFGIILSFIALLLINIF